MTQLTIDTSEPMVDVAARLVSNGFADAAVQRDQFGSFVKVTDPDGQPGQFHEPLRPA